jgi:glycosyltransferase involved in cell wall biosynthesis
LEKRKKVLGSVLMQSCIRNSHDVFGGNVKFYTGNSCPLLDGLTLFRFAHIYRNPSAGGVESYLSNLNRILLERNRMRILQMYLTREDGPLQVQSERIGYGELIWVPSYYRGDLGQQVSKYHSICARLKSWRNDRHEIRHDFLISSLENYKPNIAVFHWISEDSKRIVEYVNKTRIPFVVVNHFHNERLKRRLIKQQISRAAAIAGVSSIDVPAFIKARFINLSDGIDTDYYSIEKVGTIDRKCQGPVIMLPARIIEGKGHLDAVQSLVTMVRRDVPVTIVFAGGVKSAKLESHIKEISVSEGIEEKIIFLGELTAEEMRNWYGASDLVILPSYSEGLPRVLIEAQSMNTPVIAYEVGGVADALVHGVGGYLIRRGDVEGLSVRMQELLMDDKLRLQMGKQGRKYVVEHFSLESLAIRHENFYARILSHSQQDIITSESN